MKVCQKCGLEKPLSDFHNQIKAPDGKQRRCKHCATGNSIAWYARNVGRVKQDRKTNPIKYKLSKQRTDRKRMLNGKVSEYLRKKCSEDLDFRLRRVLRSRLSNALKGKLKSLRTLELLGCSLEHLKAWLEFWMQPGMTWDNYGIDGWHIDHKKPCASFNLVNPEEQRACFHYTNLRPLWAPENLQKGDKSL